MSEANLENPKPESRAQSRVIRLVRPSVVVLCGPAGCGKSTFATRHFRPTQIISSDQCRAIVCDDERDQRFQSQTFTLLHTIVEQRLSINRLCVVDSTALTTQARHSLLEIARRYRVPCAVLLFDIPLQTCLARDQARAQVGGRPVGQAAIERQYGLFEQAKSVIRLEGFNQVTELRNEDLENVRIEILFRPAPREADRPPARPEIRRPIPPTVRPQVTPRIPQPQAVRAPMTRTPPPVTRPTAPAQPQASPSPAAAPPPPAQAQPRPADGVSGQSRGTAASPTHPAAPPAQSQSSAKPADPSQSVPRKPEPPGSTSGPAS